MNEQNLDMKLPSGEVTLLFTDIEGSTRLWETQPEAMRVALARHDQLLRSAIEGSSGYVFKTVGDAFCASFGEAADALKAALVAQEALAAEAWPEGLTLRVRMALHTGICDEREGDYFGPTVNRTARLEAVAHGSQTVLSGATVGRVQSALPDGVALADLGEHRLKDLGQPEHVYQLDVEGYDRRYPPLRSLDNPELGNNLPQQLTSFVGRETEMTELRRLLETSRLVTLAGAGGVGKSRLAIQLAADLLDGSGNGVWLVQLAPLSDPDLVPHALASVLSVRDQPGRPILETLLDVLRDRKLLVVLDNCEHLILACAQVADALLRSCPDIEILATSREPLAIDGESVYRVPSLSLPLSQNLEGMRVSEAVQLFVARASARDGTFDLDEVNAAAVASICRRLDGIPLALELAASRLGSLSATDIDARLDDRFGFLTTGRRTALARQQTLRAMVDWSYELLGPSERLLLSRSSVFAGGFALEMAEAVCSGGEIDKSEVLDLVASLVDKSLVQADTSGPKVRYRLLETIRQYAGQRLAEHGEVDIIRHRHCLAFLALAEAAAPHLKAHGQADWLRRLDLEFDNCRVAIASSLADPDAADVALRFCVALRRFWDVRGHLGEGVDTIETALERPDALEPTTLRAEALAAAAQVEIRAGMMTRGRNRAEEGLVIARRDGAPFLVADLLCRLVFAASRQGDRSSAVFRRADEAVELARPSGDHALIGDALTMRGVLWQELDPSRTRADNVEAISSFRLAGDRRQSGIALNNLSLAEMGEGDYTAARAHLQEARVIAQDLGDISRLPLLEFNAGLAAVLEEDYETALVLFTDSLLNAGNLGNRNDVILDIFGFALCATAAGENTRAASLHGATDALLADELVLDVLEAQLATRDRELLRERLGTEAFVAAFDGGRQLSEKVAIAMALRDESGSSSP